MVISDLLSRNASTSFMSSTSVWSLDNSSLVTAPISRTIRSGVADYQITELSSTPLGSTGSVTESTSFTLFKGVPIKFLVKTRPSYGSPSFNFLQRNSIFSSYSNFDNFVLNRSGMRRDFNSFFQNLNSPVVNDLFNTALNYWSNTVLQASSKFSDELASSKASSEHTGLSTSTSFDTSLYLYREKLLHLIGTSVTLPFINADQDFKR